MWYVYITYSNNVTATFCLLFIILKYFLLCHNYVIDLFDVVTFFDNIRITLYFDTFELRLEETLQLRFVFACRCDVFSLGHNYIIYLFNKIRFLITLDSQYGNSIAIPLCLCPSFWLNFYYVTITLFIFRCSYVF